MPGRAAYDGRIYIADTSAWANAAHPAVKDEWAAALRNRIRALRLKELELKSER